MSLPAASKVISTAESTTKSSAVATVKVPEPLSVSVAALLPSPDIDRAPPVRLTAPAKLVFLAISTVSALPSKVM